MNDSQLSTFVLLSLFNKNIEILSMFLKFSFIHVCMDNYVTIQYIAINIVYIFSYLPPK
jgi:hypothetical protein